MIRNIVQNKIDKKKLRSFSRFLSRKPHIAGQERDRELATWIKDKWEARMLQPFAIDWI